MRTEHNVKLSASEVAQLWSSYMNSSMCHCLFTYFSKVVEDTQIKSILEMGLELTEEHLQKLTTIFHEEKYPVPQGFVINEDVNASAPRLFSDSFMLYISYSMGTMALNFYAVAKTVSVRADIDAYFSECIHELSEFDSLTKNLLLSKGLFIRSPYLNPAQEVNFVKDQTFMSGWFGEKRPLSAIEITHLFINLQRNALGKAVMIGFSQVAQSKEVGKFMVRGKEIARKHTEVFGSVLKDDDLPVPMTWDNEITSSKIAPFSDKLMMFMTTALTGLSIGFYGTAMATSTRKDLSVHYVRLSAEIAKYAEDGANIMINNNWLEEPPLSEDRDKLANT
ncbi:DUF3231 family protein [Priestia aryabhattai]|uniref:DUF3231 family protein n=1 Tax=Priestia aryabhattai TaxID=412384 RepID=UPI001C0E0214|nr:DUF3231 family protein [Priestia aryabhattai]MBU3574127.1 DUF3231 family protein [Priestia aryabhattai]